MPTLSSLIGITCSLLGGCLTFGGNLDWLKDGAPLVTKDALFLNKLSPVPSLVSLRPPRPIHSRTPHQSFSPLSPVASLPLRGTAVPSAYGSSPAARCQMEAVHQPTSRRCFFPPNLQKPSCYPQMLPITTKLLERVTFPHRLQFLSSLSLLDSLQPGFRHQHLLQLFLPRSPGTKCSRPFSASFSVTSAQRLSPAEHSRLGTLSRLGFQDTTHSRGLSHLTGCSFSCSSAGGFFCLASKS